MDLNNEFWDCNCQENYIHRKSKGNYCPKCKTWSDDQPDSSNNEVLAFYEPSKDEVVQRGSDSVTVDASTIWIKDDVFSECRSLDVELDTEEMYEVLDELQYRAKKPALEAALEATRVVMRDLIFEILERNE